MVSNWFFDVILWSRWWQCSQSTLVTTISSNIIIKNGLIEIDWFMIEFTQLISVKMVKQQILLIFYIKISEAKNANGGVWPTDFSKIHKRPGGVNYIYNILTGYHFKSPYGIDIPKGKSFNPYFDHMILGMPRVTYLFFKKTCFWRIFFDFSNWWMDWSNMMMVPLLPPPKWHLMCQISSTTSKEDMGLKDRTRKWGTICMKIIWSVFILW